MGVNVNNSKFDESVVYDERALIGFNPLEWKEVFSDSDKYKVFERRVTVSNEGVSGITLLATSLIQGISKECTRTQQIKISKEQVTPKEIKESGKKEKAPDFDLLVLSLEDPIEPEKASVAEEAKASDLDTLVNFFKGKGKDFNGRTVKEIQEFSRIQKEEEHDYIQWLFPLKAASVFNMNVIILTDEIITALKKEPEIIAQFRASLDAMLAFYGLEWNEDVIQPDADFGTESEKDRSQWLNFYNHNYLRLSRIMGSLHLLGLEKECQALLACLLEIHKKFPERINEETLGYWRKAVSAS